MENNKLTLSELAFREWKEHRENLITRTKEEIKKEQLIIRSAEATLDRLSRQLEALENQAK
jgi:hypothetical protein|tara:strand:- start:138 stop:320 length:183 start_codon:yes stop_codon:yes gene_type:complete